MKVKTLVPNQFQEEALKKLRQTKEQRGIVVMPTGTGKTFLAAMWFKEKLEENPSAKLLFVCHNRDILSQANEQEFQSCLRDLNISFGYYNAEEKNVQQATFATTQTLVRQLEAFSESFFDYIIVDEAHHYQARTFRTLVGYFEPKFMLALTATPNRMDGKSILDVCGDILYSAKISSAIQLGILSKFDYYCVDNDIDFSELVFGNRRYKERDLNRLLCIKEYDEAVVSEFFKTVKDKKQKTICFCATIEHAHRLAALFVRHNVRAVALTNADPEGSKITAKKRTGIIKAFRKGLYEIIFVRDLFNEGIDIPDADCIMMLRPTSSHTIFTQQLGRGLRVSLEKERLLVLDFTGNAKTCYIDLDVLSGIIEKDIIKYVKLGPHTRKSEIIIVQNGCKIRLSKLKIDLIKASYKHRGTYSKQQLIDIYVAAREQLGRPVVAKDIKKLQIPDRQVYKRVFGVSWAEFKKQMGDGITKRQALKEGRVFMKKHGRVPTVRDLRKTKIPCDNTLRSLFGSYAGYLNALGAKPNKHTKLDVDREKLISAYHELKAKLGRVPLHSELCASVPYNFEAQCRQYFCRGYRDFLKIVDPENYLVYRLIFGKAMSKRGLAVPENILDQLITEYQNKTTLNEISKKYDISKPLLSDVLSKLGVHSQQPRKNHTNVKTVSHYKPKKYIFNNRSRLVANRESMTKKTYNWGSHAFKSTEAKQPLRHKIISKIRDGATILILESPELLAVKEIEKQNKKPAMIYIPNNKEYDNVRRALRTYTTDLNITLINTSAVQLLADLEDELDFIWLDYCGAFSYYIQDLDVLFARQLRDVTLNLTYNVFDPAKTNDSYYFTAVIDYVLKKTGKTHRLRLLKDVSYRYKRRMYNVGFDLKVAN